MLLKRFLIGTAIACMALFTGAIASAPAESAPLPDLWVDAVILGDPLTLSPSEIFSYVVVVTNQGASMASGETRVTAQLPSKVTFDYAVEATFPSNLGVTCTFKAPVVTCVGPPLVSGGHYLVRIQAQVKPNAQGGAVMNAIIDPFAQVPEAIENNNADRVKVKIQ